MHRRRVLTALVVMTLAISMVACTRVKPEPEESLSLSTGHPSLSAEVVEPPSAVTADTAQAAALGTTTESPLVEAGLENTGASLPAASLVAPTPEPRQVTHTVSWGDTLLSIALQYGARMEQISQANSLQNNVIYIGQVLTIPLPEIPAGAQQYVVQPGDSLYGIAEYLSVSVDDLMSVNGLTNGYYLQVGQVLIVPSGGVLPEAAGTSVQAAGLGQQRSHIIQPGDSLSSLALMYNVPPEEIARANAITDPNLLQVGQSIIIP